MYASPLTIGTVIDLYNSPVALGSFSYSQTGDSGNGGSIALTSTGGRIILDNGGVRAYAYSVPGRSKTGGDISFNTHSGDISLINSYLYSYSYSYFGNADNGGAISFHTHSGNISLINLNSFSYSSSYLDSSNAGAISFNTDSGTITLTNSDLDSSTSTFGNGGNGGVISFNTNSGTITLTNSDSLSSAYSFKNAGNGGAIFISARGGAIVGSQSTLTSYAVSELGDSGNGGIVTLAANSDISGLTINTIASGGSSGDVTINGSGDLLLDQVNILTAQRIEICPAICPPDPLLPVNLISKGQAGNVTVDSIGNLTFRNSVIQSDSRSDNPAGNISITSPGIISFNNSQIISNTSGGGGAGNISVNADQIWLIGSNTGLFANTQDQRVTLLPGVAFTEVGDSGQLLGAAQTVPTQIQGGAVNAITGSLSDLNDVDLYSIELEGNQTFSATIANSSQVVDTRLFLFNSQGIGVYANDDVSRFNYQSALPASHPLTPANSGTYYLAVTSYPKIPVSPTGEIFDLTNFTAITPPTGTGGTLPLSDWVVDGTDQGNYTINLTGLPGLKPVDLTLPGGTGGNITLTANTLVVTEGAKVSATTEGAGNGGNLFINVADTLTLDGDGTGLFATTALGSSGQGGSIIIDSQQVLMSNGTGIAVDSQGTGNGGSVRLRAGNLTFNDRAFLTATTASGEGGNITLQIDNRLLLLTNSLISATAGGTGNGGNLEIRAGEFIIAVPSENSDIIANAFQGKGGNVTITTQAIFGLGFRPRLTPLSDITASSEFGLQGNVVITTPNVDPSRGIVHLPASVTDASQQISQGCRSGGQAGRFVVIGKGGLPANPGDTIAGDALWEDMREGGTALAQTGGQPSQSTTNSTVQGRSLVPAQGWVIDEKGMVTLVASPHPLACHEQPKPKL